MKEFDMFTDPERMKALFQRRLPFYSQGDRTIRTCGIEVFRNRTLSKNPLKYKCPMEVRYILEGVDRSGRACEMEELYAKVYNRGQSEDDFKKIKDANASDSQLEGFIAHLSDFDMIVWGFPNDPGLSKLSEMLSLEKIKRYFPYHNFPSGLDGPSDIIEVIKDIVNYRAERRCLVRYSLMWGDLAKPSTFTLFGKMFRDDRGKEIYRRMLTLYAISAESPVSFLVARPLGYNDEMQTVWQEAFQGAPLVSVVDPTNYQYFMKKVAEGIGNFHHCEIPSSDSISSEDRLKEVKKKATVLAYTYPKFKEMLFTIVKGLENKASCLSPAKNKIIHADFTIDQLRACRNEVAFFDYDEFALGDPCQDLVKFIVDLCFRGFDFNLVKRMASSFFGEYQQHAGWEVSLDRLNWQMQAQCIIEAYIFYTRQEPELEAKLVKVIELSRMECGPEGFKPLRVTYPSLPRSASSGL